VDSSVLTSRLIFWAFSVSIASVLALVALDRRQPARRQRLAPRGQPLPDPLPSDGGRADAAVPRAVIRQMPSRPYRRTPLWRRLLAGAGLGVMGTVIGAIVAIVVAAAAIALMLLLAGAVR
jgi:hypothetical protein